MIRIAVTPEAFEAISATLPLGSVGFEREPDDNGDRLIWLDEPVVNRLRALRGPGESYSDVILHLATLSVPVQDFVNHDSQTVPQGNLSSPRRRRI